MKISFLTKSKTTYTPKIQKVQIPENHISKKKKKKTHTLLLLMSWQNPHYLGFATQPLFQLSK